MAQVDDGGVGYNSELTFTATVAGTYYVEASGYGDAAAGTYKASLVTRPYPTYVFTGVAGGTQGTDWNGIKKILDPQGHITYEYFNWSYYPNFSSLNGGSTIEGLYANDPLSTIATDVVIGPAGGNLAYQVVINDLGFFSTRPAADALSIAAGSSPTVNLDVLAPLTLGAGTGNSGFSLINNGGMTVLNSKLVIGGDISNAGLLTIRNIYGASHGSWVQLKNDVTLSGSGQVILDDDNLPGNYADEITGGSTTTPVTLHNTSTIRGAGTIGSGVIFEDRGTNQNLLILDNKAGGVVNASSASNALYINAVSVTNAGLFEATGGAPSNAGIPNGLVIFNTTVVQSGAGAIRAIGAGSTVTLDDATMQGGLLATSNGGVVTTAGTATTVLDGSSAAGAVTIAGSFVVGLQPRPLLSRGAIVNTGTMTVASCRLPWGRNKSRAGRCDAHRRRTDRHGGHGPSAITGSDPIDRATLHNVDNDFRRGTIGSGVSLRTLHPS